MGRRACRDPGEWVKSKTAKENTDVTGGGKIGKVESITKQGKLVAYEAHVTTNGKRSEIQVGPDGRPLAHEE